MSFTIAEVEAKFATHIPPIMEGLKSYGDFERDELSEIFAVLNEGELRDFVDLMVIYDLHKELLEATDNNRDRSTEDCIDIAIAALIAKHKDDHPAPQILRKMISRNTYNYYEHKRVAIPAAKRLIQQTLYYSTTEANAFVENLWTKYVFQMPEIAPLLADQFHSCIIKYNRTFDDCKKFTPFESNVRLTNSFDTNIFIDLLQGQGLAQQKDRLESLGRNNHVNVTKKAKKLAVKSLVKHLYFNTSEAVAYVNNAQGHHILEIPAMAPVVNSTFYRCIIGDFNSFDVCQSRAAVELWEIYTMMARKEDRQALLTAQGLFDQRDYFNSLARNASAADGDRFCMNPDKICYDPAVVRERLDLFGISEQTLPGIEQALATTASTYLLIASVSVLATVAVLKATGNLKLITQPCVKAASLISDAVKYGYSIFKSQTVSTRPSQSGYSRVAMADENDLSPIIGKDEDFSEAHRVFIGHQPR
jgi:hypothetical protein